jgi:hypothetical protein
MQLDLDDAEAEQLREALDAHLEEMRHVWSRTEDRDYRHHLWETISRLEAIAERLPPAQHKGNVSAMF